MFITEREVLTQTGIEVTRTNVSLAQLMVETYVGRGESDIEENKDKELMAQAITFQAIYLDGQPDNVMTTAAATFMSQGSTSVSFNLESFAPFMSPWALKATQRLSWMRSRSVSTGRVVQKRRGSAFDALTHDVGGY